MLQRSAQRNLYYRKLKNAVIVKQINHTVLGIETGAPREEKKH